MSLLLDALKKAAEQKAAKSKQGESADAEATDSGLESAADDAEDNSLPRHRLEDETGLEYSQPDARPRHVQDDGDETGLDAAGSMDSSLSSLRGGPKSGEDETMIFSVDDVAENVAENASPPPAAEDETDLSIHGVEAAGASGIEVEEIDANRLAEDETDLGQLLAEQAAASRGASGGDAADRPAEDETDLGELMAARPDAARDADDAARNRPDSDETDLGQLAAAAGESEHAAPDSLDAGSPGDDADDPGFPELLDDADESWRSEADATGASPPQTSDFTGKAPAAAYAGPGTALDDDDTGADSEDMSLLLIEREPTQITSPRSKTSPQSPLDVLQSLQAEAPTAEELGLIDTTRYRDGDEASARAATTQTRDQTGSTATTRKRASDTATTGIATATANLGNVPRPDPNAAQGHAPDNYDRTLMRLPNEEASRLFADITSGSDVVMTPDYAKRVFRSKSSATRMQHVKIYSGIAIAILLAIGIYGILEYQTEAENIEANLRPLKNDPLPGTLRREAASVTVDPLFAEAEVNERALEVLQTAENLEAQSADGEQPAAGAGSSDATGTADSNDASGSAAREAPVEAGTVPRENAVTAVAVEDDASPQTVVSSAPEPPAPAPRTVRVETSVATGAAPANSSSRLQIESRERLEEKQVLLREAYAAFRAGDDALALQRYNRVLEIDPANRNALLARGAIKVHNGNGAAAIEDYQALLLANPKDSLAMASLLAVANVSPLESQTQLKLMIRDEPDSPHLNFALANAYAAQQRWHEAQRYYFTALQNNPEDPNYAYNLAVSLEHISQPKAAISYYRRALENYNKGLATFSRDAVSRRLEKLANS